MFSELLPEPLHPAVVHLPVALAVVTPLFAALAAWAIARWGLGRQAWLGVVLLNALLFGSALLALETGEAEEERVERVVAERFIEEHEEAAERFLWLAGIAAAVSVAGLLGTRVGRSARVASVVVSAVALAAAVAVGHSGGELVYVHGAANAYVDSSTGVAGGGSGVASAPERPALR
jgi:uncharacterized membrane protein